MPFVTTSPQSTATRQLIVIVLEMVFLTLGSTALAAGSLPVNHGSAAAVASLSPPVPAAAARLAGASGNWWQAVAAQLAAAEYAPAVARNELRAPNRAQNLRMCFRQHGIEVMPWVRPDGGPSWRLGWKATGLGRGDQMREVGPSTPRVVADRVVYERDGWSEWYENTAQGLEQGFTIQNRLSGRGPLRVVGQIGGSLQPALDHGRSAVDFLDAEGTPVLRYGELRAWDARGDEIPARLAVAGTELAILIDDSTADYPLTVDPLMSSPAWTAEGDQVDAAFGSAVATAGDVNGDGFTDVIVGAPNFDSVGWVFVYHGSLCGLGPAPAWSAHGDQIGMNFGRSVAAAGDVNGDGFDDVIIGAPGPITSPARGQAFVYHGSATGLAANPAWTAQGGADGDGFGGAVASAGDVNGDDVDDVVVGASHAANQERGEAYVYHGAAPSGLAATPAWTDQGPGPSALFGSAVSTAGDVNGNEVADIVIGAPGSDSGKGRAFLYLGSQPGGVSIDPDWQYGGSQNGDELGNAVAGAGDVNGDGFDDVIIGAWLYRDQSEGGNVFVFHGRTGGLGGVAWRAKGNQPGAHCGFSVGTAEDVNCDGYADIIVGVPGYNVTPDGGRVLVWQGSADGLGAQGWPGNADWQATAGQGAADFGRAVGSAGDVNGDSFSDIIIGAPAYDNGQLGEGRAFVYHGWRDSYACACPLCTPTSGRYADNFPTTNTGFPFSATARMDGAHSVTMDLATVETPLRWVRSDSAFVDTQHANAAVYLRWRVIPGPCQPNLTHPFFISYPPNAWHAARMDTAKAHGCGTTVPGSYMSCFHELDPRNGTYWSGTPPMVEPCDDILPDGLFTPGTRVQYFFELRDATSQAVVATFPHGVHCNPIDTAANYRKWWLETGVLPELDPSCDGTYAHNMLIINDYADDDVPGVATEMRERLVATLSSLGLDFDIYDHVGSNYATSYDGIGRREDRPTQQPRPPLNGATDLQLTQYDCIWYYSGLSTEGTLSDRRTLSIFGGQPSMDQQKLETWLSDCSTEDRLLVLEGLGWASDIDIRTVNGPVFLANRGIDLLADDYAVMANDYRRGARVRGLAPGMNFEDGEVFASGCSGACPPCPDRLPIDVFTAGTGAEPVVHFVESLDGCGDPFDCADDIYRPTWLAVTRRAKPAHLCEKSVAMSFPYTYLYELDCSWPGYESEFDDFVITGQSAWLMIDLFQWAGMVIHSSPISVSEGPGALLRSELYPAMPNPANPGTTIQYTLTERGPVSLSIYDLSGRLVRRLVNAMQDPQDGPFAIAWDGLNDDGTAVGSGVFFYELRVADRKLSKKVVVLK